MSKLIVSEFVTLDGVMEAPGGEQGHPHSGWVFDFMSEAQEEYKLKETMDAESLLLGRVTYEGFAEAWPGRDGPFADKMNSMPKHVVTSSSDDLEWQNSSRVEGSPTEGIQELKQADGGPILVAGSCTLVHSLIENGLVDELRLMVFPVAVGGGKRVFPETEAKSTFRLADSQAFDSGVQVQTFEPA